MAGTVEVKNGRKRQVVAPTTMPRRPGPVRLGDPKHPKTPAPAPEAAKPKSKE